MAAPTHNRPMDGQDETMRGGVDRRRFLRLTLGLGLGTGLAGSLLAACGPSASGGPSPTAAPAKPAESKPAAPAPTAAPAKPAEAAKPAAPAQTAPAKVSEPAKSPPSTANQFDQLVEGAKKEGEVSILEAVSKTETIESIAKAFREKWGLPSSFKLNHTVKSTAEVASGVSAEIRAGRVTIDVPWVAGNVDLFKSAKAAGELLQYEPSQYATVFKPNVEKLGLEYSAGSYYPVQFYTFQPVWNKSKLKIEFNSWKDMLNIPAEFKGRVIQGDIRNSASQLDAHIGLRTKLDADLWKQYKEKYAPILVIRIDDMVQKIVAGEVDFSNFCTYSRAYQWWLQDKSQNFGIAWPAEGLTPLPAHMAILAKAPHPNAAKLFAEYITTKEAMQNWVNRELQWPLRNDYTIEGDLAQYMKKADSVSWVSLDWSKITKAERDAKRDEFRQIFGG